MRYKVFLTKENTFHGVRGVIRGDRQIIPCQLGSVAWVVLELSLSEKDKLTKLGFKVTEDSQMQMDAAPA